MAMTAREIRLKSRPEGLPQAENFELATVELGSPGAGEVLVRNAWMSVDPYMRGRMYDRPSYVPPFELGKALQGGAVGRVVDSADERFKPGDRWIHVRMARGVSRQRQWRSCLMWARRRRRFRRARHAGADHLCRVSPHRRRKRWVTLGAEGRGLNRVPDREIRGCTVVAGRLG